MFTGVKNCLDVADFLLWAGCDPLAAAGACLDSATDDCRVSFGNRANGRPGEYLRKVAMLLSSAEQQIQEQEGRLLCNEYRVKKVKYPNKRGCSMIAKDGRWKTINLRDRHFLKTAVLGVELLAENEPVVYSDLDGDCYRETAVVSITLETEPSCGLEGVMGWFTGHEPALDTAMLYRIKPVKVEYTAATMLLTLTFDTKDLIQPSAYTFGGYGYKDMDCSNLNLGCDFGDDGIVNGDCPLAQAINIYNIYPDETACNAQIGYDGDALKCSCNKDGCVANCSPACTAETGIAGMLRIIPAEADPEDENRTCGCFLKTAVSSTCTAVDSFCCRTEPDWVRVWYLAGEERDSHTLQQANGDLIWVRQDVDYELKIKVFALVAKSLPSNCGVTAGLASGQQSTSSTWAHRATFLHAIENLSDGVLGQRWEKIPDPNNPIVDKLAGIPATFEFSRESTASNSLGVERIERGKLTIDTSYKCVTTNARAVVEGYGRWWTIETIEPSSTGGTVFELSRRLI